MSDRIYLEHIGSVEVTSLMYELKPGIEQETVLYHLLRALDFNVRDHSRTILGALDYDDDCGERLSDLLRKAAGL